MSENEIQILREEIRRIYKDNKESNKEIKDTLNVLSGAINSVHLLIVEDYIKRDEFEENRKEMLKEMEKLEQEHKSDIKDMQNNFKEIRSERYKIAGLACTLTGIVTSIVFSVINAFK